MITKKHLLVAILATCLLTMFLIAIVPIRSSPGVGDYNARLDNNGDGVIDGSDLSSAARAFGTAGDPTLPVVTTANYSQITNSIMLPAYSYWSPRQYSTAGFRKVTVSVYANLTEGGAYTSVTYVIYVGFIVSTSVISSYQVDEFGDTAYEPSHLPLLQPFQYANCTTRTYDVTGPTIWYCVYNTSPEAMYVSVSLFMTA